MDEPSRRARPGYGLRRCYTISSSGARGVVLRPPPPQRVPTAESLGAVRSYNVVDSLDLPVPVSHSLAQLLDGSLNEATRRLQRFQAEVVEFSEAEETADDSTTDGGEETEGYTSDDASGERTAGYLGRSQRTKPKRDVEVLDEFIAEAFRQLNSIREEVSGLLPTLPTSEDLKQRYRTASAAVERKAVIDALARNYNKANDLLQSLASFSASSLPERPALPSLTAARATFTEYGRRFSRSASLSRSPSIDGASPVPEPPLTAIRSFLANESTKLQARLPSLPTSPGLENLAGSISNALHDAGSFMHDEGEKLVDFVVDEADKLRNALAHGADRLLHYHELPDRWKNNKYILTGYRFIPIDRPGELVLSGFQWHNETINIYTHLLPALYIPYYVYFVFPNTPLGNSAQNTFVDRAISLTFLFASEVCLLLSAAWHLAAGCGTYSVFNGCATLDYLGISSLISSSALSLTHQGFRCMPTQDLIYCSITGLIGVLGLYLPWKAWFNKRENKHLRISFFLIMAIGGAAPLVHMGYLFGAAETWRLYSPIAFSILAYVVGLLFYAFDFPEVLRPGGLFDTLFHSHQFWHGAIVTAIALHWWALSRLSQEALVGFSCAASPPSTIQQASQWLLRNEL